MMCGRLHRLRLNRALIEKHTLMSDNALISKTDTENNKTVCQILDIRDPQKYVH